MNTFLFIISLYLVFVLVVYVIGFFLCSQPLQKEESRILDIFLAKTSKIPALIEVMRPYVFDTNAFSAITKLHSESMIRRFTTIYDLLEHNARIQNEFLFLMKLSMQITTLQKDEYFVYIRDFIIDYERALHDDFALFNTQVKKWNTFVFLKNITGIGFFLPGKEKMPI
jgi:hypothetical protein